MKEQRVIEGLNDLLAKTYDSERGFENAADKTNNNLLKAYYFSRAANRNIFGKQIKDLLRSLDAKIEKGTSIKGDLHNTWINFKTVFSMDKEEAILDEIERGEKACLKEYNEFLSIHDLSSKIRTTIEDQKKNIESTLRKVDLLDEKFA